MKVKDVKKLTPFERMLFWIVERHTIFLKRQQGDPPPWTTNEALQNFFFTNPYRENDKTTIWFRDNVRGPLKDDPAVLMATVAFRWFNLPRTGDILRGVVNADTLKPSRFPSLLVDWDEKKAIARLEKARKHGPLFTGGFMIKCGNGPPGSKMPMVCKAISNVWKERKRLVQLCKDDCRLEALHTELCKFHGLGGFMAYEIVCDLRYTYLLENATDKMTWTNLGPGAKKGLARVLELPMFTNSHGKLLSQAIKDPMKKMQELTARINKALPKHMPKFEMRETEHSCCEFFKMEAAMYGLAKMKRRYNGV